MSFRSCNGSAFKRWSAFDKCSKVKHFARESLSSYLLLHLLLIFWEHPACATGLVFRGQWRDSGTKEPCCYTVVLPEAEVAHFYVLWQLHSLL